MTPDSTQQLCECQSPEQCRHCREEEVLLQGNRAPITELLWVSRQEFVVSGGGQHSSRLLHKQRGHNVLGYIFTHVSFSSFRSSRGSSWAEGTMFPLAGWWGARSATECKQIEEFLGCITHSKLWSLSQHLSIHFTSLLSAWMVFSAGIKQASTNVCSLYKNQDLLFLYLNWHNNEYSREKLIVLLSYITLDIPQKPRGEE